MIAAVFSFLLVALSLFALPSPCSPGTSSRCSMPPFLVVGTKPNVLIILDNSNSMDEDFDAAPVGSWASSSKSVKAKQALLGLVEKYHTRMRMGLMGYKTNDASSYYLYSSQYFASYQPQSYCPRSVVPTTCVSWCQTGNSTPATDANKTDCQAKCSANNSEFNATYLDEIIRRYPAYPNNATSIRARYCALNYPKTLAIQNPNDPTRYIYSKGQYAMYSSGSTFSYDYCYAGQGTTYNTGDGVSNSYRCYSSKTGVRDGNNNTVLASVLGYGGSVASISWYPTDSDWALGFGNFGRRNTVLGPNPVGRTLYVAASTSCTNPSRGYLYVPVADATATDLASTYQRLKYKLATKENNQTGYVKSTCRTQSNANTTSTSNSMYYCHMINAGPTPTWGALNTAYQYFSNSLGSSRPSPITGLPCENNYIIYVTDGLPSVNSTACVDSQYPETLMPEVLDKLRALRSVPYPGGGTNSTVLTYILGLGLSDQAKLQLDKMAAAGGTNGSNNGHAFSANTPEELQAALNQIFGEIGQSTGSAGAVATVSQEISTGDVIVRGAFRAYNATTPLPLIWQGHLESYWPYHGCSSYTTNSTKCDAMSGCQYLNGNCTGTLYSFQLPDNSENNRFCSDSDFIGGNCTDDALVLKNQGHAARTIFTRLANSWKPFTTSTIDNSTLKNRYDFTNDGAVNSADTTALIKWIRGDNSSAPKGRRVRGWLLGDIVYSTPVVVSAPSVASVPRTLASAGCDSSGSCSGNAATQCFPCFQSTYLHRDQMVYVGANDGMLHGFTLGKYSGSADAYIFDPTRNSTIGPDLGKERWAYIPSNFLSSLQTIAKCTYGEPSNCSHRFMVDLSPQSWDIWRSNSTLGHPTWRTTLLGGERDGGDVYFALDVTNPANGTTVYEHSVLKNFPAPNGTLFANSTWVTRLYNDMQIYPLSRSLPCMARFGTGNSTSYAAISGGGIREFEPGSLALPSMNSTATLRSRRGWHYLYYPTFRAVDMGGTDIWRSTWRTLLGQDSYKSYFYVNNSTNATFVMPWTVSNIVAFDIFSSDGLPVISGGTADGFHDVAYAGDVNGTFYTLVLKGQNSSDIPRCVMTRKTKSIPSSASTNYYRGSRQPIAVTPVAAYDSDGNIRVYFGTGKFDDTATATHDDKTDNATMSFYCMLEPLNSTSIECSQNASFAGNPVATPPPFYMYEKCRSYGTGNTWVKNATTPSGDSCFKCSLDFTTPGERVTDSALVAGGYVFFTTFVPDPDVCAGSGNSSLYVVDYECGPVSTSVIGGAIRRTVIQSSDGDAIAALKVELGRGMASRPVLDSSGTSILIQTSENRLIRLDVNIDIPSQTIMRGWITGPYNSNATKP